MFPNYKAQGKWGKNTGPELDRELELHAVAKRKALGLWKDHRGRQSMPESGHLSAQGERTPGRSLPLPSQDGDRSS